MTRGKFQCYNSVAARSTPEVLTTSHLTHRSRKVVLSIAGRLAAEASARWPSAPKFECVCPRKMDLLLQMTSFGPSRQQTLLHSSQPHSQCSHGLHPKCHSPRFVPSHGTPSGFGKCARMSLYHEEARATPTSKSNHQPPSRDKSIHHQRWQRQPPEPPARTPLSSDVTSFQDFLRGEHASYFQVTNSVNNICLPDWASACSYVL